MITLELGKDDVYGLISLVNDLTDEEVASIHGVDANLVKATIYKIKAGLKDVKEGQTFGVTVRR